MGYYINLEAISIDKYKEILRKADLIPSWMVLKENINENMEIIKKQNIGNIGELKEAIKNKDKVQAFSKKTGLPENYVTVLRRVVNGYHPKPNKIKDFNFIDDDVVLSLEKLGLKNTLQLYDRIINAKKRHELAEESGVSKHEIERLARLADLSRIKWVNHTFAYVLLEAGYDTAEKVANADSQTLYEAVKQLNEDRKIYNAHIGAHDMKLVIEAAKWLSFEIEY